jgi:hypothetical protein
MRIAIASNELLKATARSLAEQLARGEYEAVIAESSASRLRADDLRNVVRDYGRTLVAPPETAYQDLDAVAVRGTTPPRWSVRAPLWTKEEGRSDLTLELTVILNAVRVSFELDDLHVL